MTEDRLIIWYAAIYAFIAFFPIIRKMLNPKNTLFTSPLLKSLGFTIVGSILVAYLYSENYIESPEFQFLEILIVFIYLYSGYNYSEFYWNSEIIRIGAFNTSVLKSIGRSFGGSKVEEIDGHQSFSIRTPYRLNYLVKAEINNEDKTGSFAVIGKSTNIQIIKIVNLLALYLIGQAVTSNNEEVKFPLFGFKTSAVLFVLVTISISIVIVYLEIDSGKNITGTLPNLYTKLLQKEAMNKLHGRTVPKLQIDAKDRAKALLDKRDSNVLKAKKEAVEGKLQSVFGEKEKIPLDKKSIERMRLMQIVKRILNSTPPWSEASLEDISKLAKGKESEVEIVIAGLRDLKEVKGIYDIWSKTYYGTSLSHWLITKILNELSDSNPTFDSVKIYPDGSGEFSITKKESKSKTRTKKS